MKEEEIKISKNRNKLGAMLHIHNIFLVVLGIL